MRAVTIERTSKTWKLVAVTGTAVFLIGLWGVVKYVTTVGQGWASVPSSIPGEITLGGLAILIVGRTGTWWNHG